mgnify:CR=1 FL=1
MYFYAQEYWQRSLFLTFWNMKKETIFVCAITFRVIFTWRRMFKLAMLSIFAIPFQIIFADSEKFEVFVSFLTLLIVNKWACFLCALSFQKISANFILWLFILIIIIIIILIILIGATRTSTLFPNLFRWFCQEDRSIQLKHHLVKIIELYLFCLRNSWSMVHISAKDSFRKFWVIGCS